KYTIFNLLFQLISSLFHLFCDVGIFPYPQLVISDRQGRLWACVADVQRFFLNSGAGFVNC
ncbi:hypothetical protein, partial [Salmonella enterica]|uniref:hypothetical protein n=1 Tax=Salmonella enterica TaxID=28901 RepID=UPI001C0A86C5